MKLLLTIFLAVAAQAAELRVGRAAVSITPPPGIPMAGYYSIRLAEGTHDDLYAKAIVLEVDGSKAALVACDVVALEEDQVTAARAAIEKLTGIRGENVILSATHSHTGPLLRRNFLAAVTGKPLEIANQYLAALPQRIAESVKLADADRQPARAWAGTGREEALSFNRRFFLKDGSVKTNAGKMNPDIVKPTGPIDPDVAVVYFDTPAAKPLATYVNFAMHLDTVGGAQFSSDYAYTLARLLGKIKGPEMLTVFTIGAAGNINHIDVKSRAPQKGHGEAERIGTILAGEVIKTYARLQPLPIASIGVGREIVKLDLPRFTPAEVEKARTIVAQFGKPKAPGTLQQSEAFKLIDVANRDGRPMAGEVTVISLGADLAFVGLPGEIFTELGLSVKLASPFRHTIVSELSGGWIGYVPNRRAYSEGGYEVVSARCAAGSGEAMAESAIRLLTSLRH